MPFKSFARKEEACLILKDAIARGAVGRHCYLDYRYKTIVPVCTVGHLFFTAILKHGRMKAPGASALAMTWLEGLTREITSDHYGLTWSEIRTIENINDARGPQAALDYISNIEVVHHVV